MRRLKANTRGHSFSKTVPTLDPSSPCRSFPLWKRVLDTTLVIAFSPVLAPLMLGLTVWVRLASPGPVLFRQDRVGQNRTVFPLLKFRSMHVQADTTAHESYVEELMRSDKPMLKLDWRGDRRLIPGARIIRSLGLDELPQLINILKGEMSLVGPRPCTPGELRHYRSDQMDRFLVPPGITGYWQVNGKNNTTFSEMIRLDSYYAQRMSLRLDLWILLRTPVAVAVQAWHSFRRES